MSSKYDDERKLGRPLKAPSSAHFKTGKKTQVSKNTGSHKSVFQGNRSGTNPLSILMAQETPKQKRQPKVDAYMVRMAKLKAQTKGN